MKRTLLSVLRDHDFAIYRGPMGCYFVEDCTHVGNGYPVFFNSNPDAPIEYSEPVYSPIEGNQIQLPSKDELSLWYRNIEELLMGLSFYCNELAWEGVRIIKVEEANTDE